MASVSTRPAIRLMSSLFCNTAVSLARNAQRSQENLATRRLSRRNGRTENHVYLKTPLKHTNRPSVTLAANWHHNLLASIPASLTFLPSIEAKDSGTFTGMVKLSITIWYLNRVLGIHWALQCPFCKETTWTQQQKQMIPLLSGVIAGLRNIIEMQSSADFCFHSSRQKMYSNAYYLHK